MFDMPETNRVARPLQMAAVLTFMASLSFWAFFQLSKRPEFAAVNAFADDPVDAIGSLAVQVAVVVSLLTLARAAQVHDTLTASAYKRRLTLHGNAVALLAIVVTLAADTWMEVQHPPPGNSLWGQLLVIGLSTVALITCAAILTTLTALRHAQAGPYSKRQVIAKGDSLSEALTDLWTLARLILAWFSQHWPWLSRPLHWVEELGNRFFEWMMSWPWIGPRLHPWRFCASVGLALGIGLAMVHGLEEGPASNLAATILVGAIFIGVEVAAVLAGFLLLGGFLGLRPPLKWQR